jgi:tyrosyl-tRNA synthetase
MSSFPSVEQQLEILLRGVAQTETLSDLRKKLEKSKATGKPLRIKYGIDPTGFDVHLGHTVPLRKLKQFQEFGHKAVLIIGTATALVGDPSGRDESRKGLDSEQIQKNAASYLEQIAKVVDITQAEIRPNNDWFGKWGFGEMLKLLGRTTVQRMLERDDFSKRFKSEPSVPIYLHECLYPLMQGWDSVEIQADVELGGTEQLFNLMVGRDLQREMGQEPQVCMTMPILRGTDGVKKMGKTAGNYVGLNELAKDQFGKTMRIPDEIMREWYELLTNFTKPEIETVLASHPNDAKKKLAGEVVRQYHGESEASRVLADWQKQFVSGGDPEEIPEFAISAEQNQNGQVNVLDLLIAAGFCKSKSEARKKVEEGAVNFGPDRAKPADFKAMIAVSPGLVIRLGRKIAKVKGV